MLFIGVCSVLCLLLCVYLGWVHEYLNEKDAMNIASSPTKSRPMTPRNVCNIYIYVCNISIRNRVHTTSYNGL